MTKDITYYQHYTEWQIFDRKSVRIKPREFAELIVAFANADGGVAAIGIENDGSITGVDQSLEKLNDLLAVPQDFCVPSVPVLRTEWIDCVDEKGHPNHVVLLEIEASTLLHANQADEVFLRVGDKSKKQTFEQRLQLMYAKGIRYYETSPVMDASVDEIDHEVVRDYCEKINYNRSVDDFLRSFGYIHTKDGQEYPSVAAILLFGKRPNVFLPKASVRVIRYKGTEALTGTRMNVVKDVEFTGRLGDVILRVKDFVATQLEEHTYLGANGQFVTDEEYPRFCWEELIVNAVGHRDYSILGTDIQIKIFTDHFTVESPGILPGMVRISNIRNEHFSRNPKIMAYLKAYKQVKEYGEGVDRMFTEMQNANLPLPEYVQSDFMVRATIRRHENTTVESKDPISAPLVPPQYPTSTPSVEKLVLKMSDEYMPLKVLMQLVEIRDVKYFREAFLNPALELGFVEKEFPNNNPKQRFHLSEEGLLRKKILQL